jgi:hypothetical protein
MYRKDTGSRYQPTVVDFFKMTASAQARFTACTRGQASPAPLLSGARDAPGSIRAWAALSLSAIAGMIGLAAVGFGELTPGRSSQGDAFLYAYAALGVAACFGALSAARVALVRGRLPYAPGVYAFPVEIVDARTSHLALVPMRDLKEARAREGERGRREVVLELEDGTVFSFPRGKRDDDLLEDLAQMREGVERAVETDDRVMLEQLDPFFEERMGEDWSALRPTDPRPPPARAPIPGLRVLVPALGLVAGALFGRGFWGARADLSDRAGLRAAAAAGDYALVDAYLDGGGRLADEGDSARFEAARAHAEEKRRRLEHYLLHGRLHLAEADDLYFADVKAEGTPAAYKAYFENGKRHLDEADDELFATVKKAGAPDGYDLYLALGSKHVDEVKKKLKPLAELATKRRARSLAPLRKLLVEQQDPDVQREARAALHARYEEVRRGYAARFEKRSAAVDLVDRLLELGEAGKSLALRLRQFPSRDLAGADEDLVRRNRGRGVRSLGYFSAPRDQARQQAIAHETLVVFSGLFGGDVVDVDPSDDAAAPDQPSLDVGCEFAPDLPFTYDLAKGVFLSVQATCDAVLKVPGDPAPAPLRFRVTFAPSRLHFTGSVSAENVYEGMMDPLPEIIAGKLRELIAPR